MICTTQFMIFVKLLSLSGFFLLGYYYFKNSHSDDFLAFLRFSSKVTIIFFVLTFLIVIFLWQVLMLPLYAQVQIDLIFLVMLSLYERQNMKWAILLSILSLKRMVLISVALIFMVFAKKDRFFLWSVILTCLFFGLYNLSDSEFLDKYVYTLESFNEGLSSLYAVDPDQLVTLLSSVDEVRGVELREVLNEISTGYSYIFFGDGMGGGVIQREVTDGNLVTVSFAHFLYVSLIAKMGLIGLGIPLVVFLSLLFKVPDSKNVIFVLAFGLIMSIFAGYLISSWAFWLCLGAGLGNCHNRGVSRKSNLG